MKNKILGFLLLLAPFYSRSQSVTVIESSGWLETATAKWQPLDSAESYHVYYSGEGITEKQIDDQLIRNYGTYYRADLPGLKAGSYTIRIVPVISGEEKESTLTETVTVEAHDRTGFSFSNGRVPGAYQADGTPKSGEVILYITETTKNTVSLEVTGANENPCIGLQMILDGFKKGEEIRPLIVRLVGQVSDLDYLNKGDIVIENENNASGYITFEGIGDDAVADGWGIRVKNASNIEIRNIGIMNCDSDEGDNISLQQNNDYIWIHHCDFFYGLAGSDADQAKGDGALDCKTSGYVTICYNHFWDSGKSNLLGIGTEDPEYLTYHHNWYDHSDSRHPRVRSHSVHVYNNYYDGNSKYGVGSTNASSVFVEANYFRNCKYPMLISMQGSDVFDEDLQINDYSDMPTFSKEDGGIIKAWNNFQTGQDRFVAYGEEGYPNSTVDFDAWVASSRDETIASSVVSYKGGNTYNNFDTDESVMYAYSADSPEDARDRVMEYAGRQNGGDFSWTFNNVTDDVSYAVDPDLKDALLTYQTELVFVQGDSTGNGGNDPGDPSDTIAVDSSDMVHNFTLSGTSSTFFSISGNLSDSKGTVYYAGLTLSQCLKIETSTSISFTSIEEATLTLVFNEDFSGEIKVNGTNYAASDGILTLTIPAGFFEITKVDVANLYYMSIVYTGDGGNGTTGISEAGISEPFIYPNPAKDHIMISSGPEIKRVEIYSPTGALVKDIEATSGTIDISRLSRGNYLLRLITVSGVISRAIFKL